YTPLQLSNAMVKLFAAENIAKVLEPSCGDGVFLDSMQEQHLLEQVKKFTAVELDTTEAKKVKIKYKLAKNVEVVNEDFFSFYNKNILKVKYDLILGNPPYIRYQYLTDSQREILSAILTSHGMKANKLINAWVGFLVACTQLLNDTGRIAFVIPAEILQVAYAEDLRLFLSNQFSKITLITFEKLVFPEIEQEVVVLIGEKGGVEKGIRIIEMNDLDGFSSLDLNANGYQKMQHAKEKWTKYFTTPVEIKIIQQIKKDVRFAPFSDFGTINVGVTTGHNDYFSIDKQTCDEYQLTDVTLPLIGRSSHAHGIHFTGKDWAKNVESGKKARLIVFPPKALKDYPLLHKKYIKLGEKNEVNKGYKCSIRDKWYIVPSIWVPDAFFLRRNNLYPKFVLNKCGAISTDTMHRMKFNEGVDADTLLLSYYNSISFSFTEICGRSYGGGVLEILPGEMGNIMLPIIKGFPADKKKELLEKIDIIVRTNENIENALDIVDKAVLVDFLGMDLELCKSCRVIWKKLQSRRLGRG
ncbi:MAG: class I SAM-dependent methyltransferase, partial [Oscillospiraceae bacterium]